MLRKIIGKIMFWKRIDTTKEIISCTIRDIALENYSDLTMKMKLKLKKVKKEKLSTFRMGMDDVIKRKFLYGKPLPVDAISDKPEEVFYEIISDVWQLAQEDKTLDTYKPSNLLECQNCGFEAEPKAYIQKRKPTRRICPSCKSFCQVEE